MLRTPRLAAARPWRRPSSWAAYVALLLLAACARKTPLREAAPSAPVTLGELAATRPGATQVFLRHRIDFCCGGSTTLEQAARDKGLAPEVLLAEIEAADRTPDADAASRWAGRPTAELIDHLVARYHRDLRRDLPHLIDLAKAVDRAHPSHASRPAGLVAHLTAMRDEVLAHLEDEEQRVFPAILAGHARRGDAGVRGLEQDHDQLGHALARSRALTGDFRPPTDACPTWRALYAGLEALERDVMLHAHLENNVLFPALPTG